MQRSVQWQLRNQRQRSKKVVQLLNRDVIELVLDNAQHNEDQIIMYMLYMLPLQLATNPYCSLDPDDFSSLYLFLSHSESNLDTSRVRPWVK